MTGFFKKLKDTAEKSIEKGVEMGSKGYDSAKDAAKRGHENSKVHEETQTKSTIENSQATQNEKISSETAQNVSTPKLSESTQEAIQALKIRFVKGEISKQEFEEKKTLLIELDEGLD